MSTASTQPDDDTRPEPPPPTQPPPTDDAGWLDGEPVWVAPDTDDGFDEGEGTAGEAAAFPPPAALAPADYPADYGESADYEAARESAAAAEESPAEGDPLPEPDFGSSPGSLTGGAINDNERFTDYLAYRTSILSKGIPIRDLDPTGRIVVRVTGLDGLPAAGVEVRITGGGVEAGLRTTADGTVRFHPEAYAAGDGPFTITAGGISAEARRDGSVRLETELPTVVEGEVALDILFLLDATGSMADEIDQLKSTIGEVAQRIGEQLAAVDMQFGMTLYRDIGDTFVTANFNFTSDVDRFARALEVVIADGGGDYAEALDEALADALGRPTWRSAGQAVQLIFLIADAPPQIGRLVPTPYTDSMLDAAARGIKIFPVSSSGTDDQAEFVFRQLAQFTGARYVFLTYGAGGRATGAATDVGERDYEELSLNDLIVRLVTEEIAALTNVVVPSIGEPEDEPTQPNSQDGN